jgi:AraC-like DNA-binding protein
MPDPKITLLSVFFLIGAAKGIFFAVALFSGKSTDKAASRYLAFLLLLFACELFSEFLDHSQYGLQYFRLMILIYPLDFLFGPLIWLYTSSITRPSLAKRSTVFLHFIPALILLPIVWQLLFQSLPGDPGFFIENPTLLQPDQIQSWISPAYTQVLGVLHIAIYLFASLRRLQRHSRSIANEFSYREGVALSWLRWLLQAFAVLLGIYAIWVVASERFSSVELIDTILNSSMVIVIYSMAYFATRQPRIFTHRISYHASRSTPIGPNPETMASNEIDDSFEAELDNEAEKYKKSALDSENSNRIRKRLIEMMKSEKPYLQSSLTLPDLAKRVSTSPNYLSQVINEQLQMNFFDFINSYRIEMAKELIINPLPHTRTILDIAMESAFNSKSAFYSAFKKNMGITLAEYKRNHP